MKNREQRPKLLTVFGRIGIGETRSMKHIIEKINNGKRILVLDTGSNEKQGTYDAIIIDDEFFITKRTAEIIASCRLPLNTIRLHSDDANDK